MSFLAPWALFLAAAAGVPLVLHLLRRRTGTRFDFPAVRYLLRAQKEHAREVRLRNLLLMLLRVAIVVAIAFAASRLAWNLSLWFRATDFRAREGSAQGMYFIAR